MISKGVSGVGNFIGDFINAAFPWVAGGIAIAIIITYGNLKKEKERV
jgi:hypothetical protein